MKITIAQTPDDVAKCWDAMAALRPHLVREEFVATVMEMFDTGYHLAFIEEDGRAVAAIGYRFLHFLLHGRHIYIDDLTTLPSARKKGYGRALLDHVFSIAAERGLAVVTLDSGPQRHDAHRLYLNSGFSIASLHFVRNTG